MLKLLSQVLPVKTELFFPIFFIIDLYLLLVASIKKDLMPYNPDQSFAKLIFGFEVSNLLATLGNRFAVFFHVFDRIELFHILTTVHQEFIKTLWKLNVAVVKTYRIKKISTIRCKND
jgi:hypothetical protein